MNLPQPTLFDDQRLGFHESIELTAQSLNAWGQSHRHWAIAFSGGKDSATAATLVDWLIRTGRVKAPESLTIFYADTRMELPALHAGAQKIMAALAKNGAKVRTVLPVMDDRFFVYMFGRGIPPPSNTFRWCTAQLKIEPMLAALKDLRDSTNEKILMITGVRLGESAARDSRIALSCGKNGAECGQGWFQETTPSSIADTLAPILHFRLCHVWDWLTIFAPSEGYPTAVVAESYGGDEATEIAARTGCVGCNLASRDLALETILRLPQWDYLRPLLELRQVYAWLKLPQNRLRKYDERKADGSLVSNPGRMGPLTMDARREGVNRVLSIQHRCNASRGDMPAIDLINAEELARIDELIRANTWPDRWSGEEMRADTVTDEIQRGGSIQKVMFEVLTNPK